MIRERVIRSLIISGAMTSRLDRLERAGLIERQPDRRDRRAVLVRLTEQGERLAEESLHAVIAADEEFLEPLSRRQRHSVASALRQLLLRARSPLSSAYGGWGPTSRSIRVSTAVWAERTAASGSSARATSSAASLTAASSM
jgi:hypothetical protein